MGKVVTVLQWLLLTVGAVTAQAVRPEPTQGLPNWLTGIIAVAVFLFLVFVAFIVNKAWCEDSSSHELNTEVTINEYAMTNGASYDTSLDTVRSSEHYEAYENVIIHKAEEKITAM
ncbi:PDZK1-interacting protein 1 [Brachyhypopomus gauderio]|uniref:PDZK1-interacting protein 1 n=1 Tax=Brachyhypopomus gauderio TaxID=698409 RepID=UPI004042A8FE